MEWQQLHYFCTLAKQEHYRKSAELLSISQPALSRSMTKLEAELGVQLFDRIGRQVELNDYGQVFLTYVEKALQTMNHAEEEIQAMLEPDRGRFSLGFLQTIGMTLLPDLLRTFATMYPRVEIQLFQNKTPTSIAMLLQREIDLCLISDPAHPLLAWQPLIREEIFLYVSQDHPMAERDSVVLSELADDPFICFKEGLGMRAITNRFCEEAGFMPKVRFEGDDVSTLAGLVSAGLGVTLIPAFAGIEAGKIKQIRVASPVCYRELGMAWLKERKLSPAAMLFKDEVFSRYDASANG